MYGRTGTLRGYYTYVFTTRDGGRGVISMANTSNIGTADAVPGDTVEAAFRGKRAAGPRALTTRAPPPEEEASAAR
ncbi:hypothetical protein B4N89_44135 [Embleya scabrispora]|uniref:Uncharacterized protein n=1 Tax=Embleya scabrispora TaxID=159449 RepID=A0A1T3NKT6_9ACTN|nr:hypothetical protein [Embleya scabrispora]OPC77493.1 hypothetical protein B4N89_44135 [Embleya scabrispora]